MSMLSLCVYSNLYGSAEQRFCDLDLGTNSVMTVFCYTYLSLKVKFKEYVFNVQFENIDAEIFKNRLGHL